MIRNLINLAATQLDPNLVRGLPRTEASQTTLLTIMNTVYLWAGIIAVIVMIIGGFFYVTSNGDANKIARGKNTILYAVVGLVVIIFAFVITQFVIGVAS